MDSFDTKMNYFDTKFFHVLLRHQCSATTSVVNLKNYDKPFIHMQLTVTSQVLMASEFAIFLLCMANSQGRGHLSGQMSSGEEESRGQMPHYT